MNFFGLGKVTLTRINIRKRDSYIGIGRKKVEKKVSLSPLDVSLAVNFNDAGTHFSLFTGFNNFGLIGGTSNFVHYFFH